MAEKKRVNHWPVMLLIALFAIIFLISLVSFQVRTTEIAVLTRLGSPIAERDTSPGWHFRLPWPIEDVWKHDRRIQIFEGQTGVYEEIYTRDQKNIIINVYAYWKVDPDNAITYMNKIGNREHAENQLNSILSHVKREVISQYNFNDLIATVRQAAEDGSVVIQDTVKLTDVEKRMNDMLRVAVQEYGIVISNVGIKHIGLPESVTQKVIARMQEDRRKIAEKTLAEGDAQAQIIQTQAQAEASNIINEGQSQATHIRAEADAKAAEYYAAFAENPDLAIFLRKLEGLRNTLEEDTTLIFDIETPPFDLFQKQAIPNLSLQSSPSTDANQ